MSKYNSRKTVIDGIIFDSKKEANYYCELKMLRMAGAVKDFELQVPFVLQEGFRYFGKAIRPIKYIADFVVEYPDGHKEVVDVKGMRTKEYMLKKKMFEHKYRDVILKEV